VLLSVSLSVAFTFVSSELLDGVGYVAALIVLLFFITVGILFDMLGVAVTSASETPFHSMASHRERGAAEAIKLLKNAEKVASICNDVVGDICGIVSGTTAAVIVVSLAAQLRNGNTMALQLLMTGLVAALTIGGKAAGKAFAISGSTKIVLAAGKCIACVKRIFHPRNR